MTFVQIIEMTTAKARRAHRRHPPPGHNVGRPQEDRAQPQLPPPGQWRTGCEGRISYLKRGHGWDRTHLDGRHGVATWCGHGVFTHNLVKIAAVAG
jgi:hypothetical protein